MKNSLKQLSIVFSAAALSVGTTFSANAMGELFDTLDTDNNNYISMEEARVHTTLASNFDQIDTNGDGSVSYAEFNAADLDN
ncbi:EF-hand domain-containing protein [Alteromonas oceanisediminis]|uniref:EF-hand domain-containing protein n=1 Tax=Alteromonas oceanisediminis TaxID=2836180 RepID=UPI001BDB433F|nr:EF-hand domain-containing protein [Alteromonas oceanisediminis]MBT0587589.1 EF-hand domain-containing protein [Alteromonas oceanisediminis]